MNAVLIPAALTLFYVGPHSLTELFGSWPIPGALVLLGLTWLAANVSLSRVVLGYHTPTDVWAGLGLALLLLAGSVYLDLAAQLAHCLAHVDSPLGTV
jgi:membrane-associated phospholipid phosphatase